jgi:hypothetical protein
MRKRKDFGLQLRHRSFFEDLADESVGVDFLGLGFVGQTDAVAEDVGGDVLDERRADEVEST